MPPGVNIVGDHATYHGRFDAPLASDIDRVAGNVSGCIGRPQYTEALPAASRDGTARVWDLHGTKLATLTGHTEAVVSAVFSPDGSRVVTASEDWTARVWDLDGTNLATLTGDTGGLYSAVFSPDGSRIVTTGGDGAARVWDLDGTNLATLTGHNGSVRSGRPIQPETLRATVSMSDARGASNRAW